MGIFHLESHDLGRFYYGLKDKLLLHTMQRAEVCYEKARIRRANIQTKEELEKYAEEMRKGFVDRLGGLPYDNSLPLNAKITGVIEEPGLKIEKVIFESRPKVYVTANLYIPEKRKDPCGAVLFQLGHGEEGKADSDYQHVARIIASAGLIVMVMDPVGQGERFNYYEPHIGRAMVPPCVADHDYAGGQCTLIGDNIARYFIADAMRAVDYLSSRPEVDSEKIGATGSSGGGTQTCHIMVCDPRIKAAAPGTFVTTRKSYSYAGGTQDAEQIRMGGTAAGFDHHEFAICFAPKPLLLLTTDTDFFPIEGANEVYEVGKRFWEMYGAGDKFKIFTDNHEHMYTIALATQAAKFFAEALNDEQRNPDEKFLKLLPQKELWCTKDGQIKLEYSDAKTVFDENLERYRTMEKPQNTLKEFLLEKMFYQREEAPLQLRSYYPQYSFGLQVVPHMWFPQAQVPNVALRFFDFDKEPNGTVICLWDQGTDNIEDHIYKIRKWCSEGKNVMVVDLSGIGKCMPNRTNTAYPEKMRYGVIDHMAKELFFLGDSLCALRLFELDYAIRAIKKTFGEDVSLYAEGVTAVLAKLYMEIDPTMDIVTAEDIPDYRSIVETKYYEEYNIANITLPGIAKYM